MNTLIRPLVPALIAFMSAAAMAGAAKPDVVWSQPGNAFPTQDLAVSPNGSLLASASDDGVVKILRTETGQLEAILGNSGWQTTSLAFLSDDILAVGDYRGNIRFHDLGSDTIIRSVQRQSGQIHDLALAEGANMLAAISMDGTILFTPATADTTSIAIRFPKTLNSVSVIPEALAVSPDGGSIVLGARKGTLVLYNPVSKAVLKTFELGEAPSDVQAVAWLSETRIVAGCKDGTIYLVHPSDGTVVDTIAPAAGEVHAIAGHTASGKYAVGHDSGKVTIYSLGTTPELKLSAHADDITALHFSADGKILYVADRTGRVAAYDASWGSNKGDIVPASGPVVSLAPLPGEGALAALHAPGMLRFLARSSGILSSINPEAPWANAAAFARDGQVIRSEGSGKLGLLPTAAGQPDGETVWWSPVIENVLCLALNSDDTRVAVGDAAGAVQILDTASGLALQTFAALHPHGVASVAFANDDTALISLGRSPMPDLTVHLLPSGNLAHTLSPAEGTFTAIAVSEDGTLLATVALSATGSSVQVLDATSDYTSLQSHTTDDTILAVAFSTDGSQLWLGSAAALIALDLSTGTITSDLEMPAVPPTAIVPLENPQELLVGFADGTILAIKDPSGATQVSDWLPAAVAHANGWYFADGFGWFHPAAYPWVWHLDHRFWYIQPVRANGLWAYDSDPQLGWLFVDTAVYPYVHSAQHGWLYFALRAGSNRWFYKAADESWITCED